MRTLFFSFDVIHFDWVLLGASLLASSELSVPNTEVEKKKKKARDGKRKERKRVRLILAPGQLFLPIGFLERN